MSEQVSSTKKLSSMWNTRRSAAAFADKIQDASERLQQVLKRNHCLGNGIEQITRQLPEMSITNINALIDRTENSIQVLELLLEVAKTQKLHLSWRGRGGANVAYCSPENNAVVCRILRRCKFGGVVQLSRWHLLRMTVNSWTWTMNGFRKSYSGMN